MKKLLSILVLCVAFTGSLLAQEEEYPAPPKPLDDDWSTWMVGSWEGEYTGPMGSAKEWMTVSLGLDGQFQMIEYKSKSQQGTYKGMGAITINPNSGDVMGYWIDNMRGMSEGTGTREGDTVTMEWDSAMGKMTRVMKKINADEFEVTIKMTGPDGSMMEGKSQMKRVAKMSGKSE